MMYLTIIVVALVAAASADVEPDDVKYFLTNSRVELLQIEIGNYGRAVIDATKPVKIMCHGWVDNVDSSWYGPTRAEYVRKSRANVIAVDWSVYAGGLYSTAVENINGVGYQVALLILDISTTYDIPLSRFHLIGHSLGAHLLGYAGKYVIGLTGQKVGRITGLDPARPSFEGVAESNRLSRNDATFVDVIHTNGGYLGYKASIGHVDFFPNGGAIQNGCGILGMACSHNRAPIYFVESINSYGFVAVACSSNSDFKNGQCSENENAVMGANVDRTVRGNFYLSTSTVSPFALGSV